VRFLVVNKRRRTSSSSLRESARKVSKESQRKLNLQLALNQANEELREANAHRRMADTKTYTVLSVTLVFFGLLSSLRPWVGMTATARVFLAAALGLYVGVIGIGVWSYFPRNFPATNARAILEDLDRGNELLMKWTTDKLVEFCDSNWRIALEKGYWIKVTMVLFLVATLLLGISLIVH